MVNATEILDQSFACLVENMGVIDAEYFIALIKRNDFDYTVWHEMQGKSFSVLKILTKVKTECILKAKANNSRWQGRIGL